MFEQGIYNRWTVGFFSTNVDIIATALLDRELRVLSPEYYKTHIEANRGKYVQGEAFWHAATRLYDLRAAGKVSSHRVLREHSYDIARQIPIQTKARRSYRSYLRQLLGSEVAGVLRLTGMYESELRVNGQLSPSRVEHFTQDNDTFILGYNPIDHKLSPMDEGSYFAYIDTQLERNYR
jgi:hypothetical protein